MENKVEEAEAIDKTKEKFLKRIKRRLGSDVVKIAISDETIKDAIDDALEMATPYVVDEVKITVPFARCIDLSRYRVQEVLEVVSGSPTVTQIDQDRGTEIMFDFQMYTPASQVVDKVSLVGSAVNPDYYIPFDFDDTSCKLYLNEGSSTGMVTFTGIVDFDSLDSIKDERAKKWIYKYALALCKETEGRIRSKFKSSNIPIEYDGEALLNEGLSEQSELESSLISGNYGAVPILR